MTFDPTLRERARDWLAAGDEAAFQAWWQALPVEQRRADPWLLLVEAAWHRQRRAGAEAAHALGRAAAAFAADDACGQFALAVAQLGLAGDRHDHAALARWAARAAGLVAAGTEIDRAEYLDNMARAAALAGDAALAEARWREVLQLPRFDSALVGTMQLQAAVYLGLLALERTELEEAARRFRRALALGRQLPPRPAIRFGTELYLARVLALQGDFEGAEAAFAALPPPAEEAQAAVAELYRAEARLAAGELAAADALLASAIARFDLVGAETAELALALGARGRLRTRQGRAPEGRRLIEQGLAIAGPRADVRAALLLGLAETTDAPAEPLREALSLAREAGVPYLEARAGLALGGEAADAANRTITRLGCFGVRREALVARPAPGPVRPAAPASTPAAPAAERALALRALGDAVVACRGETITQWPRRRARLLIFALALAPAGYAKEDLAELLAPDLGFAEAEHQLDNTMSTLRKQLEPQLVGKQPSAFLEVRDRRYRLRPETFSADFQAFNAALSHAAAAVTAGDGRGQRDALALAMEIYAGDLLAEPFFAAHFTTEREHFRQRFLEAALALAELHHEDAEDEAARACWERVLEIDPACDEAHEALIEAYEDLGRRSLADQQRRRREEAMKKLGLLA